MSYSIGVDLGGTNIKAVAVTGSGQVLDHITAATEDDDSTRWAGRVRELINTLAGRRDEPPACVGLASPGMVARDGRSIAAVHGQLERLAGLDWTTFLKTTAPVLVLNDAHAALLGEVWQGAAVGCQDAVLLTLGTGGGGAILAGGRLLKGHTGRGGHIGHICLNIDGPPDAIGIPGSLEEAIGDRTLAARSAGRFTSTERLVAAHLAGDEAATRVWLRSVYQLACAVASVINLLDPEVVIIGGGIARADRALFDPLEEYLEHLEWRPDGHRVRLLPAALGDLAGALGAAYNAMRA
ncbi:MAG: ROK family protein [Pyrinomonadaceae bacterium]